jgi:hypothetical protein
MKFEQRVSSLELSKRLKELGVKQESLFYYISFNGGSDFNLCFNRGNGEYCDLTDLDVLNDGYLRRNGNEFYSAFTVAELGEMLTGKAIRDYFKRTGYGYVVKGVSYHRLLTLLTKPDELAKMLIYLLENKLIQP